MSVAVTASAVIAFFLFVDLLSGEGLSPQASGPVPVIQNSMRERNA
jgi:hypothetical protein